MRWEYDLKYSVGENDVRAAQMIVRVSGEETINGLKYWKHVGTSVGVPGELPSVTYERLGEGGLFVISEKQDGTRSAEFLALPLPVAPGRSWTTTTSDGMTSVMKAEDIEDVDLPDKTYRNCLKIHMRTQFPGNGPSLEGWSYLAPGVGQVKRVLKLPRATMELTLVRHQS
jgi:hypothetical protein